MVQRQDATFTEWRAESDSPRAHRDLSLAGVFLDREERIFVNAVFFVVGFVVVFSVVGILLQTLLSTAAHTLMGALTLVGGAIIVLFGIFLILSTRYLVPILGREYKLPVRRFRSSYLSSIVLGIGFAIGWTPCVGPILGSIYALAAASPNLGFLLLLSYSLGLAIPFLIFGAFISRLSGFIKRARPFLQYFNVAVGIFLIALGVLVLTGYIGVLSVYLVGGAGYYISLSGPLNFIIAMVAGFLTFLSPCILPLVPVFFSFMAGTAAQEVAKG